LRRSGHDVTILGYRRVYPSVLFPGTDEREDTSAVGEAVIDTLSPLSWRALRRELSRRAPDLVVVQWWHPIATPAVLTALSAVEVPKLVICHNFVPHEWFPLAAVAARAVASRSTTVLCHSRAVAGQVLRAHPQVPVAVVSMPMLLRPPEAPVETAAIRSRLRIGRNVPVALFLGLIRRYKGVNLLLEAWCRARLPDTARLVIAGESYLGRGALMAMVEGVIEDGSVVVEDRYLSRREFWEFLAIADVLILPYRRASQSGLIPLARAVGVRLLVAEAGGLAEAGSVPGSQISTFTSGDSRALAEALEQELGGGGRRSYGSGERERCASYDDSWWPLTKALEQVVRG